MRTVITDPCISDGKTCTFIQTGRTFADQKWYRCEDCGLDYSFCEACTKKCHEGHTVHECEEGSCFCDCPDCGHCQCCPLSSINCDPNPDHSYFCKTCDIHGICEACKEICHASHDIVDEPEVHQCNCDDCCKVKFSEKFYLQGARGVCTFVNYNEKPISQPIYECETCGLTGDFCCCEACAAKCHRGHNVHLYGYSSESYCDCGSGSKCHCRFTGSK